MKNQLPIIAAFDFDGTFTRSDVLIPFFCFVFGSRRTYWKLASLSPHLAGFVLGIKTRQEAKEFILTAFLQGLSMPPLADLAKTFAEGPLMRLIKEEAWNRYQWHKKQGHICVLVSANISLFLAPWAQYTHFDYLLASEIEVVDGNRISGKLKGLNCWGKEKVRRLETLFGPKSGYLLYAYGDSRGDQELLSFADYPHYQTFTQNA
jgi:phosphatidylglycerophosphatase C